MHIILLRLSYLMMLTKGRLGFLQHRHSFSLRHITKIEKKLCIVAISVSGLLLPLVLKCIWFDIRVIYIYSCVVVIMMSVMTSSKSLMIWMQPIALNDLFVFHAGQQQRKFYFILSFGMQINVFPSYGMPVIGLNLKIETKIQWCCQQ